MNKPDSIETVKKYLQEFMGEDISDIDKFYPIYETIISNRKDNKVANGELIVVYRSQDIKSFEEEIENVKYKFFDVSSIHYLNTDNSIERTDYSGKLFHSKRLGGCIGESVAINHLYVNRNNINKWIAVWVSLIFTDKETKFKLPYSSQGKVIDKFFDSQKTNYSFRDGNTYRDLIPIDPITILSLVNVKSLNGIKNLNKFCQFLAAIIYTSLKEHPFFIIKFKTKN